MGKNAKDIIAFIEEFRTENKSLVEDLGDDRFRISDIFKSEHNSDKKMEVVRRFRKKAKQVGSIRDFFTELFNTTDAQQLVQPILTGAMLEGTEMESDIASLFPVIKVDERKAIEYPLSGEITVDFTNEMQPYKVSMMDFARFRASDNYNLRKYGCVIALSDEIVDSNDWDVVGAWLRRAGRAMRRFRNAWISREFYRSAHVLFDNSLSTPQARTTGLGQDGLPNGSLHYLDAVKMSMALVMSDFTPTHLLINGIAYPVFIDNEVLGSFGRFQYNRLLNIPRPLDNIDIKNTNGYIERAFSGLIKVIVSHEIPIDTVNNTYDIYMVDANEVGALLQKEDITIPADQWRDPGKDILNIKARAIECPAIYHHGRAIVAARNIALVPTYNSPIIVKSV